MTEQQKSFSYLVLTASFLFAASVCLFVPDQLLSRFANLQGPVEGRRLLIYGLGIGLLAIGLAFWFQRRSNMKDGAKPLVLGGLMVALFLAFTQQLDAWWIDDAGITFSYSRSLAEGYGLTFQPGQPPTEGYSSTLWMLILAAANSFGAGIPQTAKVLGIGLGSLVIVIVLYIVWDWTRSYMVLVLSGVAMSTAPFVVWSASGQEHALQAFLLTLTAYCATRLENWRSAIAGLLSLLVLTRPETPIIVIFVVLAVTVSAVRTGSLQLRKNAILAIAPGLTFAALMGWRIWYFGDFLPNPYYAKASDSTITGLLNPFGAGWSYVLDGLRESGMAILLPLLFLPWLNSRSVSFTVFTALVAGHMFFVIWAKGDWMGQYRFLMPITTFLVVPAALGLSAMISKDARTMLGSVLSVFLILTTVSQLDSFDSEPTTPLSLVSKIGQEFSALSDQLDIEEAALAHHDAGGIGFSRAISLVDLGGLVDRNIAKNMADRNFLEWYVFEKKKPHFIFGVDSVFAAASGFTQSSIFDRDYVPLRFEGRPYMKSDLSHIRREVVKEKPGITVERDETGEILTVIVNAPKGV